MPSSPTSTVVARIEPSDPSFLDVRSAAEARAGVDAAAAARTHAEAQVSRAQAELDFARAELSGCAPWPAATRSPPTNSTPRERRAKTAEAALAEAQARAPGARVRVPGGPRPAGVAGDVPQRQRRLRLRGSPLARQRPVLRIVTESEGSCRPARRWSRSAVRSSSKSSSTCCRRTRYASKPGQRVIIEAWGGEQPLAGRVRRVEPFGFTKVSALGIEEQRVNVVIDITEPARATGCGSATATGSSRVSCCGRRRRAARAAVGAVPPGRPVGGVRRAAEAAPCCATWRSARAMASRPRCAPGSSPASGSCCTPVTGCPPVPASSSGAQLTQHSSSTTVVPYSPTSSGPPTGARVDKSGWHTPRENDMENYQALHARSISDPEGFWARAGRR